MRFAAALWLALAAAMLPLLLLLPLGALWLWQQGWLLPWLAVSAVLGAIAYGGLWWLGGRPEAGARSDPGPLSEPDPEFSPRDAEAWTTVVELAAAADPTLVLDRSRLLDAARMTIERVAVHYHPGSKHPAWHFTLPELFLLSERVSQRLRQVMLTQVPGSHVVRAGDVVRLWDFKPWASQGMRVARGAGVAWRLLRLINPGSALLAEVREKLVAAALGEAGDWLKRRGAQLWIEEVGRAAIELYSGRLGLDAAALEAADRLPESIRPAAPPGPLRVLIAGQVNAGKSSLVNALLENRAAGVDVLPHTDRCAAYRIGDLVLLDAPGLATSADIQGLVQLALEADILLWVVAAHRADRALDVAALAAIRDRFVATPTRRLPPIRAIASHVDRLSPAREWSPPYDLADTGSPKAMQIRAALEAIATDLGLAPEHLLPVRLQPEALRYNLELVWPLLASGLETGHQARALRLAAGADPSRWGRLWDQAQAAGRVLWREARG